MAVRYLEIYNIRYLWFVIIDVIPSFGSLPDTPNDRKIVFVSNYGVKLSKIPVILNSNDNIILLALPFQFTKKNSNLIGRLLSHLM